MIWKKRGHSVTITSRDKDVTLYLLDRTGFPHINLGRSGTTPLGLVRELPVRIAKLISVVRRERPAVMTAIAGTFIAPAGRITRTPAATFYDTEHAGVSNAIAYPLSHHLFLPSCYRKTVKFRHVTYNGYHELAYLHPDYFTPDPGVLGQLGVREGEKYVIMRFVSWTAGHDIGHRGLSPGMKRAAVEAFSRRARVFITTEGELPLDMASYRINIPPERMHDALSYAELYYGESATMASECAVLGTPAVYLDNVGRGYTDEQERVYGAVFNYTCSPGDYKKSVLTGVELLTDDTAKAAWRDKRNRIIRDKIDVTRFVADAVETAGGSPLSPGG